MVICCTLHLMPFRKALLMVRVWAVSSTAVTWPWYVPSASPQSNDTTLPTNPADIVWNTIHYIWYYLYIRKLKVFFFNFVYKFVFGVVQDTSEIKFDQNILKFQQDSSLCRSKGQYYLTFFLPWRVYSISIILKKTQQIYKSQCKPVMGYEQTRNTVIWDM